jgi:hypothetical protein
MVDGPTLYPHRLNNDGTFDSICPKCFLTIAKSPAEIGLTEGETAHICGTSVFDGTRTFQRDEFVRTSNSVGPASVFPQSLSWRSAASRLACLTSARRSRGLMSKLTSHHTL